MHYYYNLHVVALQHYYQTIITTCIVVLDMIYQYVNENKLMADSNLSKTSVYAIPVQTIVALT